MTMPETTPEPANCPYCPHPAHRPGVECESIVEHSPERWHRCLCLNLVDADAPCPPQMDCQGGALGYSDTWHLVRGRGPHAAPEPADRAALRDRISAALYERATPGCRWADLHPDDRVALWDDADAVLAVLPAHAGQAAEVEPLRVENSRMRHELEVMYGGAFDSVKDAPVDASLRDRIRRAVCEAEGFAWDDDGLEPDEYGEVADAVLAVLPAPADRAVECPECDNTGACNGGPCPLRRLADESQQPTSVPATCPAPTSRQSEWCAAADALDAGTARFIAEWPDERQSPYMQGRRDAAAYLRTLADEAGQSEAEAHRTLTEWIAEVLEVDGMWMYLGTGPDRSVAERRRASVTRRHPGAETRTVRKTTTYTVADDAQQPVPADRGTTAAIDETAATIQAEEEQGPAAELTATLVIGRSESHCGNCSEPTLMGCTHHVDVSGWSPQPGGGCGARFTAMRSDYRGVTEANLKAIRPDLPVEAEGAQQPKVRAVPTVAYSGKGRAFCLTCPRPAGEDVPLTVNDIAPCECCAACGRDLRDVAEGAQR